MEPSPESSNILGLDWHKEVQTVRAPEKVRNEFYRKVAQRRLNYKTQNDQNLKELLKDPSKEELKTAEELKNHSESWTVDKNTRLSKILDEYFQKLGVSDPKKRSQEVGLSFYCLTKQHVNVDLVVAGWKVDIIDGKLFITTSSGAERIKGGADLRAIPATAYRPKKEKAPKKDDERSAPPPKLTQATGGKESDILEMI